MVTIERKKLEQVLEALDSKYIVGCSEWRGQQLKALTAIKEALVAPVQEPFDTHASPGQAVDTHSRKPAQEPVAWGVFEGSLHDIFFTQAEAQEMAELKGSHAKVLPLYTAPQPQEFVCSTDLCHFTLIQTNVGIGERGMEAYEAAKKRGWVGVSDERMMEMPKQEPVAWGFENSAITGSNRWMMLREKVPPNDQYKGALWTPLYTTPPQCPWVGLTSEEIYACDEECNMPQYDITNADLQSFAKAIEAKLKEKNT